MRKLLILVIAFMTLISKAHAGQMEISGSFSFSQSDYGNSNYQWSRRWSGSIGYLFWQGVSEIELAYYDNFIRTQIEGYQNTSFHDQVYSVQWVQSFTKRDYFFQPYIKVGIGQLNRTASGSYESGGAPPAIFDSVTGVIGAGLRIYIMRRFSIKVEATSYLTGAVLATWKDNVAIMAGIGVYF